MKRISIVGLCLAAVFAFSAMVASSASATPGLLLARVAGGGSIAGVSFLSSAVSPRLILHNSGKEIICKDATNRGLWLSPTLGDILIQFLGCTAEGGLLECKTSGAAAGEIHLPLGGTSFHLGLAHLSSTVGKIPAIVVLLNKDVNINCGGLAEILVLGAVIGALQLDPSEQPIPLNAPFSTAILNFQQTAPGLQHLRLLLFEDTLNTYDLRSLVTELGTTVPLQLSSEVALALLDLFTLSSGAHVSLELFEN